MAGKDTARDSTGREEEARGKRNMKTLVIAEKPSVASDLARALGNVPKQGEYFENEDYVISSAVGHLVELFMPEDIDKKLKRWSLNSLPIVPDKFELKPIEKNKKKFEELKRLMRRKDVGMIVNACDAGREGELIFTYIYDLAGTDKPMRRLWLQSMTQTAIRKGFDELRDPDVMQPLQEAARCRSESDWLIGINGTRAITSRMFGHRGGSAATVGRVQTPTLSMVYEREIAIRNFKPRAYWRLVGRFGLKAGDYEGVYQKKDYKKAEGDEHDRIDRIWDKETAARILEEVRGYEQVAVSEEKKRSRQSAPRLYDLTSLQREANGRYGFGAGRTLQIAQALYEKHKVLTYPRTDSRALPEDYGDNVQDVLRALGETYRPFADRILEQRWVNTQDKRIFNNKQVSDHFAIIPTHASAKKLNEDEQKIFDMVSRRFLAIFFPMAEFDVTTRLSRAGEHTFKTEGKILAVPGWLEVYGRDNQSSSDTLPPISTEDGAPAQAAVNEVNLEEDQTRPPPRFNEGTLLAAMEGAGKLVEDDELAEAMKEKGLGTPATRAQIIDHLLREKYIEKDQRELRPTGKAEALMEFLRSARIDYLTSPEMTGDWEFRLHQIENGRLTRAEFMNGIIDMTKKIVDRTRDFEPPVEESSITSPTDGKPLLETYREYHSHDTIEDGRGKEVPKLIVYKTIGNRKMEEKEVEKLVEEGQVGPLDGFRSKAGKPYSAVLRINEKDTGAQRVEFVFDRGDGGGENGDEEMDLSTFPVVGKDPLTGAPVHETTSAYVSETHKKGDPKSGFWMSRTLLGKPVPGEQVKKLLEEGKTDLIEGFKSKRTGRFFKAHLTLKDGGSGIGFEFPPRAAGKGKARKKAAGKKSAPAKSGGES